MNDYAPARRSFLKTRTIDVTFTVILGLLTVVFGYYVFTSIRNFRVAKAKKALVASVVSHYKTIHRHKKRHLKPAAKSAAPKILVVDTAEVLPYQKPISPPQIYADKNSIRIPPISEVSPNEAKPVIETQSTEKQPVKEASLPYTTYLRANETGVINMRKFDNYGSEIIRVIPTNSKVSVLERGPAYYKVLFENTTGYVAKWNVLKK